MTVSEFLLRCVISGAIATALYLTSATLIAKFYGRRVSRSVFAYDVKFGVMSVVFGSPIIQGFSMLAERYHISFVYSGIATKGWLYWVVSIPLYVLLWDLVFYLTHLILHVPIVYRKSHFRHHACRPPVAYSGVAIDPFETILSGMMPYIIPLFIAPFHTYTVYALNITLMLWATLLHSSNAWSGNPIFITPKDHNLHHHFGLKNANFAAVFTFWDRIGRTLNRETVPPWWGMEFWKPSAAKAAVIEGQELPVAAMQSSEPAA